MDIWAENPGGDQFSYPFADGFGHPTTGEYDTYHHGHGPYNFDLKAHRTESVEQNSGGHRYIDGTHVQPGERATCNLEVRKNLLQPVFFTRRFNLGEVTPAQR